MKVIPLVRLVLKWFGASPSLGQNKFYRIYSYTVLIIMTANLYAYVFISHINTLIKCFFSIFLLFFFQFLAFSEKWQNASLFCQTLAMSMGAFSAVAKSSTLIFSRQTFKTILDGIQKMLDKSKYPTKRE